MPSKRCTLKDCMVDKTQPYFISFLVSSGYSLFVTVWGVCYATMSKESRQKFLEGALWKRYIILGTLMAFLGFGKSYAWHMSITMIRYCGSTSTIEEYAVQLRVQPYTMPIARSSLCCLNFSWKEKESQYLKYYLCSCVLLVWCWCRLLDLQSFQISTRTSQIIPFGDIQ